jgi:hypothetical protein
MEVETTAAPAATGGEVTTGLDLQAMLDGEAPQQAEQTSTEPTPTPESQSEPQQDQQVEPEQAKADEDKPAEQTAEEFSEPLPGKLGKLLETLGKDAKTADLARQIRADHEALNGPEGFRGMFKTVDEAREYKTVAPTVDDLKVMSDFSERYGYVDRLYTSDPVNLIRTLAEDGPAFQGVAKAFEPALRQLNDPQVYETAARPFNQNFWRNVMGQVQRDGTPEEIQLFEAFQQKYLGNMSQGQRNDFGPRQNGNPEQQRFEAERNDFYRARNDSMFQEVKRDGRKAIQDEARKFISEKVGTGIPKAVRDEYLDEMSAHVTDAIWKEFNSNPLVVRDLNEILSNGDYSPAHKQALLDRVMTRAKAALASTSAPEITRVMGRIRKLAGGNGNASTTTTTGPSKDVGSGSPTTGAVKSGPMPRGAPPGFNNMKQEDQAKYVNWGKMGDDADEIFINAAMSGDWSKVVMKGT